MDHLPTPSAPPRRPATILVIDDCPETLEEVCQLLEAAGFLVRAQLGPFGTTAAVAQQRPDLVVLDVMMPGLSGQRLAQLVRARSEVPIVFLSAMPEEELRDMTRELPRTSYVLRSEGGRYLCDEIRSRLRSEHRPTGS
jgi:DNA-binding response OmpR family regulator